jgi:hypothetical protein
VKIDLPLAIVLIVIVGGLSIIAVIVSMTMITIGGQQIPAGVSALYGAIVTGFLAALSALVSHSVGFSDGTINGQAQTQAEALKLVVNPSQPATSPPHWNA